MNVEAVVEVRGKSLSSQTLTTTYFAFYDSVRLGHTLWYAAYTQCS
jgi:hypothetical protein